MSRHLKNTLMFCSGVILAILVFLAGMYARTLLDGRSYSAEDKLADAVEILREYYVGELDEEAMADNAIAAMVDTTRDRWSYYMTAEGYASYLDSQNNQYGGLGLVIANDEAGLAYIKKVYAQSPAGAAGIQAESRFSAIGEADASAWDMNAVSARLQERIQAGEVDLTLLTPDGSAQSFHLIPGAVLTDPVASAILDSGFGYIRIENFENRSASMSIEAVDELVQKQVPGIIFDVRQNPGGQLSELLKLLDHLLPEGKLFLSRTADGKDEIDWSDAQCVELPMAVLVDGDSYSAAEFFAAALREYGWASIVGSPTTGKGRAQVTVLLKDGSAIHISAFSYLTPEGRDLTDVGLTPDVPVDLDNEDRSELYYGLLPFEADEQLLAAEEVLRAEAAPVS